MPLRVNRAAHDVPRRLPRPALRAARDRARRRGSLLWRRRALHPAVVHGPRPSSWRRLRFPARRLDGARERVRPGARYEAVIAPFAGGAILPAAYAGARPVRTTVCTVGFRVVPAPLGVACACAAGHASHLPPRRRGRRLRRARAPVRGSYPRARRRRVRSAAGGRTGAVRREVSAAEIERFRTDYSLGERPLVLYTGGS